MICRNVSQVKSTQVTKFKSDGKTLVVKDTRIKWLTHRKLGGDEYQHNHALRHFTLGPGGEIPMHRHKYTQIMYMLTGKALCGAISREGELEEREVVPGDCIYTYSFEPHDVKNPSQTEPATFLCCIDCVDDKQNCTSPVEE